MKTQDFEVTAASAIRISERTEKIASITDIINKLFRPDREVCAEKINGMINEAFELGDTLYGVAAAAEWAGGFRIPASAVEDDLRLFLSCGESIAAMAAVKLESINGSRLSWARIESCISSDNPDRNRLVLLAGGMCVPLAPEFAPNGGIRPVKLRRLYLETKGAVDKFFFA